MSDPVIPDVPDPDDDDDEAIGTEDDDEAYTDENA